ncbi:hypothetical protein NSU_3299 [Novosphingobium pentaromativorans US6-1]|uniref:Uncharacterized protein n=1 Tax=Novosphingobium pentaromativorans US6-1 TaxID=1088721 RepID=G6EG28_9SPHN|nr:hypothetical protein NSU_3299 [Novosphingobium pentaromativorans US6-1]
MLETSVLFPRDPVRWPGAGWFQRQMLRLSLCAAPYRSGKEKPGHFDRV